MEKIQVAETAAHGVATLFMKREKDLLLSFRLDVTFT